MNGGIQYLSVGSCIPVKLYKVKCYRLVLHVSIYDKNSRDLMSGFVGGEYSSTTSGFAPRLTRRPGAVEKMSEQMDLTTRSYNVAL
jgi:hypothetical protein